MFGLFKKKVNVSGARERVDTLISTSAQMLNMQLQLCHPSIIDMNGDFVRGYIFGFFHSTFVEGGIRVSEDLFPALMLRAYETANLTGINDGGDYFFDTAKRQNTEAFNKGQMAGGGEHHAFYHGSSKTPVGLAGHFHRG